MKIVPGSLVRRLYDDDGVDDPTHDRGAYLVIAVDLRESVLDPDSEPRWYASYLDLRSSFVFSNDRFNDLEVLA